MASRKRLHRLLAIATAAAIIPLTAGGFTVATAAAGANDTPTPRPLPKKFQLEPEGEGAQKLLDAYYETKYLSGDTEIDDERAAQLKLASAAQASALRTQLGATSAGGQSLPWVPLGPNPTVQIGRTSGTPEAVSGRIGDIVVNSKGMIYLGAANGGVWTWDPATGVWTPRTDSLPTLATGALALAPSNEKVVYLGSGEGALSGDSHSGLGIFRSDDAGKTWQHVSGDRFLGESTSRLVVDPRNPMHVYAAMLRGRGGSLRVTTPPSSSYGVWESTDGGVHWTLRMGTTDQFRGATDLEMDPQNAKVLWASFWGKGIFKTTDGGLTWVKSMAGLPNGDWANGATRFSLAVSHPSSSSAAVVYAGFDWFNKEGHHPSQLFRSTDGGDHWVNAGNGSASGPEADSVLNYCDIQCSYDNVVTVDPTNPNILYAAGEYDYPIASGGIYRSLDGGATWLSLGYDLHPDFHAVALQPNDPSHVVIGNDGGVWQSHNYGGRLSASKPLSTVDWKNLNGTVDPATGAVLGRSNLQITQFNSVATVPQVPGRFWGGTQDNGTQRKSTLSDSWFDVGNGDGGNVLVDPESNYADPAAPKYVFGSFFSISPYRFSDGGASFFSQEFIRTGIDLTDRSEFYVPWAMNHGNTNQLFLGTFRMYRTNNAKAAKSSDVLWTPISGDLTGGCKGQAPNGGRGCLISAVGVSDGGTGVYSGSDDGYVYVSPDAVSAAKPTFVRSGKGFFPYRPVSSFAVDKSNWRTAYASFTGYGAATPHRTGHVFKTTNGGQTWTDISSNLPDTPVNTVVLDPTFPNTLYAGSDVGSFITRNGGASWQPLGTGMPIVSVDSLDLDTTNRVLLAGTHGRGAFKMDDGVSAPALVVSAADAGVPVGPGSDLNYTVKVRNVGNADATGVRISVPLPGNTSFASADSGGGYDSANKLVKFKGLTVPAGGSTSVHFTVKISPTLPAGTTAIVVDGIAVRSDQGASTFGSPQSTTIAPEHALTVSTPILVNGNKVGQPVDYSVTVQNLGFATDTYNVSVASGFAASVFDATCTTPVATTGSVTAGQSLTLCVRVTVPAGATNGQSDTATVHVTSVGAPAVSGSVAVKTIAVAVDTLLVDEDGNAPDVQSFYETALTTAGVAHSTWDLATVANLPTTYTNAFKKIVWFTGSAYPGPLLPYEDLLSGFLDNGGRLFVSGMDILDQGAGTTDFVKNYLHVNWDGTDIQNDIPTAAVHAAAANPLSSGFGTVPLDLAVQLGAQFSDQLTPIAPAQVAFNDDSGKPDAINVAAAAYKVVFLAFPFEEFGTAAQKADFMTRVNTYFAP